MIGLHDVNPRIPDIIFPLLPCDNEYHNGYDYERRAPSGHGWCIRRSLETEFPNNAELNRNGYTVYYCECLTCTGENLHYFPQMDNYMRERYTSRYICTPCQRGEHPRRED